MAYFSNGSEGDLAERQNCGRCVHQSDSGIECPVMQLHLEWNYDAVGSDADLTKKQALETLWPTEELPRGKFPGKCGMLVERVLETEGE